MGQVLAQVAGLALGVREPLGDATRPTEGMRQTRGEIADLSQPVGQAQRETCPLAEGVLARLPERDNDPDEGLGLAAGRVPDAYCCQL
jgi:hypothetical protein